jgi:RNA polymerase sigma-70 factor (ECF subfamily)
MEAERLMRACAAGDPEAWKRFVAEFGAWLRQAAARCAPTEADDVVAELYRTLLEKDRALLKSFRPPYSLRAWLAVLVRRVANRLGRRARPRTGIPGEPPAPPPAPEAASPVRELLAELPVQDRVMLLMFFEDGASYEEISAVTGIAVDSLGKRKYRALQALREIARRKKIEFPPGSGPPGGIQE